MDRKFIRLAACLALSSLLLRADEHGEHAAPANTAKPDSHAPPARSAAEVLGEGLMRWMREEKCVVVMGGNRKVGRFKLGATVVAARPNDQDDFGLP